MCGGWGLGGVWVIGWEWVMGEHKFNSFSTNNAKTKKTATRLDPWEILGIGVGANQKKSYSRTIIGG